MSESFKNGASMAGWKEWLEELNTMIGISFRILGTTPEKSFPKTLVIVKGLHAEIAAADDPKDESENES